MKINKFLIFILLAFCFTSFINFDIYANDNTINLQDKCNLLTNKDDVDISSIDDLDIEYNIQDYADSYIYLLEDDKYLRYSNKSNSGTSIDYFKYGGNIYEQGAGLIANASDAITKIIPEEYFKMVGEYSYFGLDYGFYIKTFIKDDIVEDYNKFNTKTLRFAYVSDIFIIDYTYLKPSYSSILQTTFKLNPLFSARYYTIETENMADHKIYLKENQNYTSLEELNVLFE